MGFIPLLGLYISGGAGFLPSTFFFKTSNPSEIFLELDCGGWLVKIGVFFGEESGKERGPVFFAATL